MCIIIIINPSIYAKSCLNAISVWAFKVLPLMFPFFVLTKLIANLNQPKDNFMDKFFNKVYHTPNGSFLTFFLSVLSGYPMGAKLICSLFENKHISNEDAKRMLSFCSISGPMFMIGTVGVSMLFSYKAGIIILISNIISSLLNGLIYRGKATLNKNNLVYSSNKKQISLSDCVYDSLVSILMVGSYIVLSFIIIDILQNLNIISFVSNSICWVFNCNNHAYVVQSILKGFIEITRGIYDLSLIDISLKVKTIVSSVVISFGGLSIMLQSLSFLNTIKLPVKTLFLQKITQALICLIVSILLCSIFI